MIDWMWSICFCLAMALILGGAIKWVVESFREDRKTDEERRKYRELKIKADMEKREKELQETKAQAEKDRIKEEEDQAWLRDQMNNPKWQCRVSFVDASPDMYTDFFDPRLYDVGSFFGFYSCSRHTSEDEARDFAWDICHGKGFSKDKKYFPSSAISKVEVV